MFCLANMCYVCLENKDSVLNNLSSSLSANSDIIHIICDLPFNLAWLKTMRTLLVCEECCSRLRETYRLRAMCLKNSAVLRNYVDNLNTGTVSNTENEAELTVTLDLHNKHKDMNEVQSTPNTGNAAALQIQSEDEEINRFHWRPNIAVIDKVFVDFEESLLKAGIISKKLVDSKQDQLSTGTIEERGDVYVNVQDYFVKDEESWKQEPVDDPEEYPMDTNSIEITAETEEDSEKREETEDTEVTEDREEHPMDNNSTNNLDNESDSEISENSNGHASNTDSVSLEFIIRKAIKCLICSKHFSSCSNLEQHMRIHTAEKPFKCSVCEKCFGRRWTLECHMRIHTGEKPYVCSTCKKCFRQRTALKYHMRTHTGEKPYVCSRCEKRFAYRSNLACHMRVHTGQ